MLWSEVQPWTLPGRSWRLCWHRLNCTGQLGTLLGQFALAGDTLGREKCGSQARGGSCEESSSGPSCGKTQGHFKALRLWQVGIWEPLEDGRAKIGVICVSTQFFKQMGWKVVKASGKQQKKNDVTLYWLHVVLTVWYFWLACLFVGGMVVFVLFWVLCFVLASFTP